MTNGITFNGVHSRTFNLVMLTSKRPLLPENKDTYIDIPHRDGSILIPDKSAKDIIIEVEFLIKRPANLYEAARNISRWLITDDRVPLIFDDDPDYYYNAKVYGNIELEKVVKSGRFTVNFRCEPYPIRRK
ncbi:putative phage tail component-like protein [Aeribacillus composti]|uniref:distal tail protein Dit n=1 Tax=Aeribacillus composti TaxID=1868734 RepID=UPI00119C13F7|nr:distal tail protein Dit [Aeribacillus composti]TVZ81294.1 putative phage tail component-like protein [Aeribacillus composti]